MSHRKHANISASSAERRRRHESSAEPGPEQVLLRRAARHRDRGNPRKAAVALRELAARSGEPAHWVALGHALGLARRREEAIDALRQGMWLHRRRGAEARARSVARLILALDPLDAGATRWAA